MIPLADKIRPKNLAEFIGQMHLVGVGAPIRLAIKQKQPFSMIFWGPPGCGKTTLARLIADSVKRQFYGLSAVSAGKADLRGIVEPIKKGLAAKGAVVFLDELHRFNKAQQDFLLPYVEDGTIVFIGATTENPSFEVISPLLSRSRVFVLKPLSPEEIKQIIKRGLKELGFTMTVKPLNLLAQFSDGDARIALNAIEVVAQVFKPGNKKITVELLTRALQKKNLLYDRAGDQHYDTISAYIKSLRASDVDAALYYLARMVEAGEDPKFIARRMIIFASEDIGIALPTALVVANETFQAVHTVGFPEAQINLATATVYLAKAPKDRSAYNAYFKALDDVKKYGNLPIPLNLRNAPTKLMKDLGYSRGYEMYAKTSLLPDKITGKKYYFTKNKKQ
ncbi:replication-associated recombination protein A [Patescibacteria group bacterium]|nr:replication-associated recombination protein A [Patescibacteria group bacterium]MBU1931459.1 replication-associated recombination protein A [Patescibacteria group bacterium]